jgi:hypothetical protein
VCGHSSMDLPIQSIESLRKAGRTAAEGGEKREANPFPAFGSHFRQWEHGHVWAAMEPVKAEQEGV